MPRSTSLLATGLVLAVHIASPALAQQTPLQPLADPMIDKQMLATGARASKIIGSAVTNEAGDKIGTIDDIIVMPTNRMLYMVVSVGGFLGIGDKLVVVPYSSISTVDRKLVLPGATKASLTALPESTYSTTVK